MNKKGKILLGTLIPLGVVSAAGIGIGITLSTGPISAKLLFKKCNSYYQPLRKQYDGYVSDEKKLKKIKEEDETKVNQLQNELNSINGDENAKAAKQKELVEAKKIQNENIKKYNDLIKKLLTLGTNLERIFKPMETAWLNIQALEKSGKMTFKLWNSSKKVLQKVQEDYEAWILQDFKNI